MALNAENYLEFIQAAQGYHSKYPIYATVNNGMTLSSNQTVTGTKTFTSTLVVSSADIDLTLGNLVMTGGLIFPAQAATASAPAYVKGGLYFDTTLNKLRVGGASGWETVTSS